MLASAWAREACEHRHAVARESQGGIAPRAGVTDGVCGSVQWGLVKVRLAA